MNMKRSYRNIALDSRTVLLGSSIQDILKKTAKTRKGIDFRLFQIPGSTREETQTVMTALASLHNPNTRDQKNNEDIDRVLSESLDKILIADRVRSCNDFYKVNNKKNMDSSNSMQVSF